MHLSHSTLFAEQSKLQDFDWILQRQLHALQNFSGLGNMNRTLAVLVGARISLGLFVVGVVVLSLWTSLGSRSRTPPVLYWSIHIDANSTLDLSKRWKGSSDFDPAKRSGIVMKDEYHVTLLYIGNSTDAEIASHNPKFSSASQVAKLRHELEQRKGEWVRVDVSNFVWEDRNKRIRVTW